MAHNRLVTGATVPRLNFREVHIAQRGSQGQLSQDRKPELLVEHVGSSSDDIPEFRVAAQTQGTPDVHAPRAVATTVEAEGPDRVGAPRAQAEVAAPVPTQQIAIEAAVGEIAGNAAGKAQPSSINGARRDPERVVVHEAEIVRCDPADPPRLVYRQSEVHPVRVFQDGSALYSTEAAQGIPEKTQCPVSQLLISHHKVALIVPASSAKGPEPPIEPALLIHVDRAGADVREHTPKAAALERPDAAIHEVVAQQIAHEKRYALRPAIPRDKRSPPGGEIEGEPATVRLSHDLGRGLAAAACPGPLRRWRTRVQHEAVLMRSGVNRIPVQVPAQVMKSSYQQ